MVSHAHTIRQTLEEYANKYGIKIFVETGTFKGKTTEIASAIFSHVYTIELSEDLHASAKSKFENLNITCLKGNSPEVLDTLLEDLKDNIIFFLDAHWAGYLSSRTEKDSPLMDELKIITKRSESFNDLVIIDDLHFFEKKGEFTYTNQKSEYFPNGGVFKWDWSNISVEKVLALFPKKKFIIKDDRLFIGIRD